MGHSSVLIRNFNTEHVTPTRPHCRGICCPPATRIGYFNQQRAAVPFQREYPLDEATARWLINFGVSSVLPAPSRQKLQLRLLPLTLPTQLHLQLKEMLPGIRTPSLGTTPSTGFPSRIWMLTLTMW